MQFEKNQIAVAIKNQRLSCGSILLHQGSIVKIYDPKVDYDGDLRVFKNWFHEIIKMGKITCVKANNLRPANEIEKKAYTEGKRNISEIT